MHESDRSLRDTHEERLIINVNSFLADVGERADRELTNAVEVRDAPVFPEPGEVYVAKRIWKRIDDVVAVVVDLKGSTRLGLGRHAETTARLYEATTGSMVRIADRFGPDFVDIQGDGLFALFHGHRRYERALCAAMTFKTFGHAHLEPSISQRLGKDFPETGLKVGVAAGRVIVKNVGVRGTNEQVWGGRPVNYAAKCAQSANKGQIVVTRQVWAKFEGNKLVTQSCACIHWLFRSINRWESMTVDTLPDADSRCRRLPERDRGWCSRDGDEICQAILDGKTKWDESGVAA